MWKNVLDNRNRKPKLSWGSHGEKFGVMQSGVGGSRGLAARSGSEGLWPQGLPYSTPCERPWLALYAPDVRWGPAHLLSCTQLHPTATSIALLLMDGVPPQTHMLNSKPQSDGIRR